MKKVIVAGSRDFNNYDLLKEMLDKLILAINDDIEIVSGTAKGADKLGEQYAQEKNISIKKFPADWDKFGKSAGYKRNQQMADYADFCIVFWDGNSRGTKHMIDIAHDKNIETNVVMYKIIEKEKK